MRGGVGVCVCVFVCRGDVGCVLCVCQGVVMARDYRLRLGMFDVMIIIDGPMPGWFIPGL